MTHTKIAMPEAGLELLIVLLVVGSAVLVHALLQRRFKSDVLRRHNDVAGYLFSAVGVIYAVVLGFVVVVVWEKYDATVANVGSEVAAVSDLYRSVGGFAEPARSRIRRNLRLYAQRVIDVEWPQMKNLVNPADDSQLLEKVAGEIDSYQPKTASQNNAQQWAMRQRSRLFDARRDRLTQAAPSVPAVLWFALIAGALAMLTFAFLFGVDNRPAQLVMTAILAGLIAILFIVINEFDNPFSGSVTISDTGWVTLLRHFPQIP